MTEISTDAVKKNLRDIAAGDRYEFKSAIAALKDNALGIAEALVAEREETAALEAEIEKYDWQPIFRAPKRTETGHINFLILGGDPDWSDGVTGYWQEDVGRWTPDGLNTIHATHFMFVRPLVASEVEAPAALRERK